MIGSRFNGSSSVGESFLLGVVRLELDCQLRLLDISGLKVSW
jgi:hypothetical protein